jgi:hypothetical protein
MMRAVIAMVVVLVILAGVLLLHSKPDSAVVVAPAVPAVELNQVSQSAMVRPETHVLECGLPDYFEDKYKDKNGTDIVVLEKGVSHEGATINYLHSPKWINKCNLDDIKEQPGVLAGLAIYNFEVKRDDTYYVFLRAKWTDTCGNSCWILMDGPEKGGHSKEAGEYSMIKDQGGYVSEKDYEVAWHPLMKSGELKGYHLAPGPHRIELHTRQDGPRFDQLVISTNPNVPVGIAKKRD